MAQLRLGILSLKIETGRFTNMPIDERVCEFCDNIVEDEMHFILACPLYDVQRNLLVEKAISVYEHFQVVSDEEKTLY
jgi:hypothetical protein